MFSADGDLIDLPNIALRCNECTILKYRMFFENEWRNLWIRSVILRAKNKWEIRFEAFEKIGCIERSNILIDRTFQFDFFFFLFETKPPRRKKKKKKIAQGTISILLE